MAKVQTFRGSSTEDGRFIQAAIDNAIREKTRELMQKHKVQLEGELENVIAQVVSTVSLNIASELNFQDMGKTIRFEIQKKWDKDV